MRVLVPVPFGEVQIDVRRTRRARPLFWATLLSAMLHCIGLLLVAAFVVRALMPIAPKQRPLIVSLSSALRIQPRAEPVPAHQPVPHRHASRSNIAQQQQPPVQSQRQPRPRHVAQTAHLRTAQRPELSKKSTVAYEKPARLTQAQVQSDSQAYEQTIANAKAANDPVAGAASTNVTPSAPTRYTLNITGNFGKPQPEGILYPLKRWVEGAYVYYYVRYTAEYANGETETGTVPWPIRFPVTNDPFARGVHRMPLPGPLPDYVLPSDITLQPLVKNCFDHHYEYCPIEKE